MTTIAAALTDLLDPTTDLAVAVDRHFAESYRQRTNGQWDDRAGFVAHIAHLRTLVARASIRVLDEVIDEHTYAERHIVDLTQHDGHLVQQEVYVFGTRDADDRFTRIEETTLMLRGDETDRGIGNAKASASATVS